MFVNLAASVQMGTITVLVLLSVFLVAATNLVCVATDVLREIYIRYRVGAKPMPHSAERQAQPPF